MAEVLEKKTKEFFQTNLDFCPRCGTVLPHIGFENVLTCQICKFQVNILDFDGVKKTTKIIFNKVDTKIGGQEESSAVLEGPTVERKCSKCGHGEMIFTTRQTRSADEGQTVFFTCPKCRFQESEFS